MDERQIQQVAAILTAWNPLGSKASEVRDLNGYRTEAIDIISAIGVFGKSKSPAKLVADLFGQGFELSLSPAQCESVAQKIVAVISRAN